MHLSFQVGATHIKEHSGHTICHFILAAHLKRRTGTVGFVPQAGTPTAPMEKEDLIKKTTGSEYNLWIISLLKPEGQHLRSHDGKWRGGNKEEERQTEKFGFTVEGF